MDNDFDLPGLEDRENFRINPHIWLRTLLAIVGDREKKEDVVRKIVAKTGIPAEKIEVIIATTISILIRETRSN
jgi:hypothetical protein